MLQACIKTAKDAVRALETYARRRPPLPPPLGARASCGASGDGKKSVFARLQLPVGAGAGPSGHAAVVDAPPKSQDAGARASSSIPEVRHEPRAGIAPPRAPSASVEPFDPLMGTHTFQAMQQPGADTVSVGDVSTGAIWLSDMDLVEVMGKAGQTAFIIRHWWEHEDEDMQVLLGECNVNRGRGVVGLTKKLSYRYSSKVC
ncbi:hypothetical protein CYMTET_26429 [Cymbomonas tetramitiformis]|uniref:Uncharacterized protein n=1 Tax=Cymbomonas tetramitiformis TaxID=36881 RepID=A0AAE0FSJ7_9CHLO|nr:hypothetical protein CYMTET_26429 [Cymbomonas tetramitiformis]